MRKENREGMSLVPDDTAIVRPMRGALKCLALSLVLIPLGYKDVTDTVHVLFLHSAQQNQTIRKTL